MLFLLILKTLLVLLFNSTHFSNHLFLNFIPKKFLILNRSLFKPLYQCFSLSKFYILPSISVFLFSVGKFSNKLGQKGKLFFLEQIIIIISIKSLPKLFRRIILEKVIYELYWVIINLLNVPEVQIDPKIKSSLHMLYYFGYFRFRISVNIDLSSDRY